MLDFSYQLLSFSFFMRGNEQTSNGSARADRSLPGSYCFRTNLTASIGSRKNQNGCLHRIVAIYCHLIPFSELDERRRPLACSS